MRAVQQPVTSKPEPAPRASRSAGETPLAGVVVGLDPGHNGGNYSSPDVINQLVFNGRQQEACDTTGTATDAGYTEASFNFSLARYLAADLENLGAHVVLTRSTNTGVGPCITDRAQIINRARADVAVDIHADGGPAGGRGFAILEPVADGPNDAVVNASAVLGRDARSALLRLTPMPTSDYDGSDGLALRKDLAGLNLTTVPKILVECGNMRNNEDAALLATPSFQLSTAAALATAIRSFLQR